ncbi:MAG TPA: protein kinase [Aggregatilineales bacterium]|nr:protein kinase [Aggregatilineales bacterium]
MADLIGYQLGQYTITALIGEGGMASVYRAYQETMQRDVAVKIIRTGPAPVEEFVRRFEREARTVASLSHAHILKVFDFGQQDDMIYLVMELLTGGSLAKLLATGALTPAEVSRLLDQIASALDHAHRRGIVHRDLKPGNVLLNDDGDAFLTDFGIAKILQDTGTVLTHTNVAMGTPAYMSPEQWRGEAVDARADIYALGVMVFEMLAGQLPFKAETPYGLMHSHVYEPKPAILTLRPELAPALDEVLNAALAKDQNTRYQTAGEFAAAFRAVAVGGATTAPMPTGMAAAPLPASKEDTPDLPAPSPSTPPRNPVAPEAAIPPAAGMGLPAADSPATPSHVPIPPRAVPTSPFRSPVFLGILAFGAVVAVGVAVLIATFVIVESQNLVGTKSTPRPTAVRYPTNTQAIAVGGATLAASATLIPSDTSEPTAVPAATDTLQPPTPIQSILIPSDTATPPPTIGNPAGTPTPVSCPDTAPSRLVIGSRGRVTLGGASNRLRDTPGGPTILAMIPQGEAFDVLSGPVCRSKIAWWQVSYNGQIGWTAESQNGDYFTEAVDSAPTFNTNLNGWKITPGSDGQPGTWTDDARGIAAQYGGGDDFYLSTDTGSDFTYEGDLSIGDGSPDGAAGLAFRVSGPLTSGYVANINMTGGGEVKLLRFPPVKLASVPVPIQRGQTYHLKVIAAGSSLKVFFNNNPVPLIDVTDTTYPSGSYGLNIFQTSAVFQNIQRHVK